LLTLDSVAAGIWSAAGSRSHAHAQAQANGFGRFRVRGALVACMALVLLASACQQQILEDLGLSDPTASNGLNESAQRDSVLALSNAARATARIAFFSPDPKLNVVAQAHARDMADRGYFGHVTPEGKTLVQRLREAGIVYSAAGENIAANFSALATVDAWMESPAHRQNLLNGAFHKLGVGVYRNSLQPQIYYVQVFTN
jgi:uncharacterized protein YkwD